MDGQTLKMIRLEKRMTQSEFGSLLGISTSMVAHIENGRRAVSDTVRARLAQVVNIDEFVSFFERYNELDDIISI